MIFHICPPDINFIRPLIDRFEKVKPGINRYVVIVSNHHIKKNIDLDRNLIEYIGPLNLAIVKKIDNSNCQGIVVHTLNDDILELALFFINRYPVFWRSWGTDLHDILYPDFNFLLPITQKLVYGGTNLHVIAANLIRPIRDHFTGRTKESKDRILKKQQFLTGIDFIATVTRTEFNMLKLQVPDMKAKYLPLNYRSLDIGVLPELNVNTNQDNLMVGHSSYAYLNHADIFDILKNDSLNVSVSTCLSYGDFVYRDKIIELGKKLLNNRFSFYKGLLKFDDYLRFINQYSAFILNSKVQSGGGNIIYFLFQGSKVYVREENPIYLDFKEEGIKLFSIQNELSNKHLHSVDFSIEDKLTNRKIIKRLFNGQKEEENVLNVYRAFFIAS